MDVIALFITDPQSPLLEEPGEDALDDAAGFPSPLPLAVYLFAIFGMIPLARRGLRIFSSAS